MCSVCNTSADYNKIVSSNIILAYLQRDCNLNSLNIEILNKFQLCFTP